MTNGAADDAGSDDNNRNKMSAVPGWARRERERKRETVYVCVCSMLRQTLSCENSKSA